jgi:antitoxin HicB
MPRNKHIGSSFDSFLEEEGILDEVEELARKKIVALRLDEMRRRRGMSVRELADRMRTSRSAVDRLLDPTKRGLTFKTVLKASKALDGQVMIDIKPRNERPAVKKPARPGGSATTRR